MRRFALSTVAVLALGLAPSVFAKTASPSKISADEILQRADEAKGPDGTFSFLVKVKDYDNDAMLRENLYRVYCKGSKLALIETLAPTRLQGRKILMRDNDLWLYLPSVRRPTRISLQQRLTGEVANGDIARTSFHEDYTPKLLGKVKRDGKPTYKLALKARHTDTTYRNIVLWVEQKTFHPIHAEFFAISGKLLKKSDYDEYEPILGQDRASKVVIRDALRPSKQSHLKYYQYRRETLDDSFFNKESMP
jgi:outer membrane lipoprotein-sorting protein